MVWQQTAIFVLGMLLPHATGHEFHLAPATRSSSSSRTTMDLEDLLAQAPHLHQICRNDTWMDPTHVVAWHTLVQEGLPLLWHWIATAEAREMALLALRVLSGYG